MKKILGFLLFTILFGFFLQTNAFADSITMFLTDSNEAALPTGQNYASVFINVNDADNKVTFTVDALASTFTSTGKNFGIKLFGFNSTLDLSSATWELPEGWSVKYDQNISEFGLFEEDVYNSKSIDPLSFSITLDGIDNLSQFINASSKGTNFVAHIIDFTYGQTGITSAYFTDAPAPVPEPATMLLLGSGLVGLAGFRRKFRK